MGLLRVLRRWLFGAVPPELDEPSTQPRPQPSPRPKLAPLRYTSSLIRTPPSREQASGPAPYRFAQRCAATGGHLNLSTDADVRWLDHFGLPHLLTPDHLADWLQLPVGKVAWLTHRVADDHRPKSVARAHYHFQWVPKGRGEYRLIEAPKQTMRRVQDKILHEMLDRIPCHPACHGFVAGRSILSNARPHCGKRVIVSYDLENFYGNVRYGRVTAIFRALGFSREVAIWLARLTTSAPPSNLPMPDGLRAPLYGYLARHLPQGAPTSPKLANLSAYGLDVRLSGLAAAWHCTYTRYADDLTFSADGRLIPGLKQFIPLIDRVLRDERFPANPRKRQVTRNSQRQVVTGVVVNRKPNIPRHEYDRLKAILHNCVTHGPAEQNRDDHPNFAAYLRGRIAHVQLLNAHRGRKLMALYQHIDWRQ